MRLQMEMEDSLLTIACSSGKKTILLCDRGMPDSAAYMAGDEQTQEAEFNTCMDQHGWTMEKLMSRYDLVIHLETAAVNTNVYEKQCENNVARNENKSEAIIQDKKTAKAWAMHPNVKLIRNLEGNTQINFEQKKQRCVQEVFQQLGLGKMVPNMHHRLFLIKTHVSSSRLLQRGLSIQQVYIESTFLQGKSNRVLEKRGTGGLSASWSYVLATSEGHDDDVKITTSRIGAYNYSEYLKTKDPKRFTVKKKRSVFVVDIAKVDRNVTHKIDEYIGLTSNHDNCNLELLSVDEAEGSDYEIPPFLMQYVEREITDPEEKAQYSLEALASRSPLPPSPLHRPLPNSPSAETLLTNLTL